MTQTQRAGTPISRVRAAVAAVGLGAALVVAAACASAAPAQQTSAFNPPPKSVGSWNTTGA
ncbi:hypothetical protein [Kitasatospora mediocidica]|uniref:hypothetical protein n=1 Tax=Kitasatospora mediocidica TaxID=58352 RepID=UPI000560217B|nr:hypothetical protein [Kitasatospora mediocidica]